MLEYYKEIPWHCTSFIVVLNYVLRQTTDDKNIELGFVIPNGVIGMSGPENIRPNVKNEKC